MGKAMQGVYGTSLHFPLNFGVNLKLPPQKNKALQINNLKQNKQNSNILPV